MGPDIDSGAGSALSEGADPPETGGRVLCVIYRSFQKWSRFPTSFLPPHSPLPLAQHSRQFPSRRQFRVAHFGLRAFTPNFRVHCRESRLFKPEIETETVVVRNWLPLRLPGVSGPSEQELISASCREVQQTFQTPRIPRQFLNPLLVVTDPVPTWFHGELTSTEIGLADQLLQQPHGDWGRQ